MKKSVVSGRFGVKITQKLLKNVERVLTAWRITPTQDGCCTSRFKTTVPLSSGCSSYKSKWVGLVPEWTIACLLISVRNPLIVFGTLVLPPPRTNPRQRKHNTVLPETTPRFFGTV